MLFKKRSNLNCLIVQVIFWNFEAVLSEGYYLHFLSTFIYNLELILLAPLMFIDVNKRMGVIHFWRHTF